MGAISFTDLRVRASVAVKPQINTRACVGPTETRFFVLMDGVAARFDWASGHPTQAAARGALTAALTEARGTSVTGEVVAMTRRASGEPLVAGERKVAAVDVTVDVTVAKLIGAATVDRSQRSGWVFYGWAAC